MSLLSELDTILKNVGIPLETGAFTEAPPDEYLVLTPMYDSFRFFADDMPQVEVSEARISLFTRKNYLKRKQELTKALLDGGMTITDRQYVGFESDTKYHHYAIDAMKQYEREVE